MFAVAHWSTIRVCTIVHCQSLVRWRRTAPPHPSIVACYVPLCCLFSPRLPPNLAAPALVLVRLYIWHSIPSQQASILQAEPLNTYRCAAPLSRA